MEVSTTPSPAASPASQTRRSSMAELFIHRPVMTMLLTLSVIVFGVFAYLELPVSDLPSVDYPVITVSASFPGMEPAAMAANIATPLEKEFMKIQGLQLATSSSSQGFTRITLQFELNKNIDAAATDVQAAISRAGGTLPPDLPAPPVYEKTDPNSHPMFYMALTSNSMTLGQLYDFATVQVGQRISILSGVSQVQVYGVPRAVRIEVDPQKLYNRGISMNELALAVRSGTVTTSAGRLEGKATLFALIPEGQLDKAIDYENLIIAYKEGSPVFLRDVADCVEGLAVTNLTMNFWAKRAPHFEAGIILAVVKAAGANTTEVSQAINTLIPEMQRTLPGSVALTPIYDSAAGILSALADVKETLYIAFVLVIAVIFVFLGKAADTIIPSTALPLSILMTFICMWIFGFSIDNLSLMALTLSIGFLVDDAIVFLENMVRRMEEGEPPLTAAINGARQITFTIISTTLSLAAVFLPLVFMGGQIGRVFREFSVTIIVAILASGLVSLTLTPMLCARILSGRIHAAKSGMQQLIDRWEEKVLRRYSSSLHWFMSRRPLSILVWTACLAGTFFFLSILPKTFLPIGDSGVVMGVFISHESSSPKQMSEYQAQIDAVVKTSPHLEASLTLTGADQFLQSSQGFVILFLKHRSERPNIEQVTEDLRRQLFVIPGVLPLIRPMPALEISTGATANMQGKYAFTLGSVDEKALYQTAMALQASLSTQPGFASVSSDLFMRSPQLRISINREHASMLGISAMQIEELLKNTYSQNYVYLIKAPTQQYQVIIAAAEKYRADPENLKLLYVPSSTGAMVPLDAVASWRFEPGPQAVNHINNFPAVTIFFDLVPGFSVDEATQKVEALAAKMVPPEIQRSFQGEASAFLETVKSLFWLMLVGLFVVYVILGILYESYIHPITVLSSLPVAMVGGLATLYIFGMELSLYGFIGLFMLIGIVKKNGIMMIDFALECRKQGLSPYDAMHRACLVRFRPILMTTLTTVMGAVPIAAGWGADGASRMPLGLSIVGGMTVAQLLTLYVTPVFYLYLETFQEKVLDKTALFRRSAE